MYALSLSLSIAHSPHSLSRKQDSALWFSWTLWLGVWSCVIGAVITATAAAVDLALVVQNSVSIFYVLVLCFLLSMSSLALLLGVFISDPSSATAVGFVVFLIGWVVQLVVVFGFPFEAAYTIAAQVVFSAQPWAIFAKALQDLDAAASSGDDTISWADRYSYCVNSKFNELAVEGKFYMYECVMPVGTVIDVLAGLAAVFVLLSIYLEAASRLRNPFFFFLPSYWSRGSRKGAHASLDSSLRSIDNGSSGSSSSSSVADTKDEGALAERKQLRAAAEAYVRGNIGPEHLPRVAALGITKEFPVSAGFIRACTRIVSNFGRVLVSCFGGRARDHDSPRWKRPPANRILQGVWLSMPRDQVTCLLGPNGAGKTTLISILCGERTQTRGASLLCGLQAAAVKSRTGICPQFDALVPYLTASEHFTLYAAMRGMRRSETKRQSDELLGKLGLAPPYAMAAEPPGLWTRMMRWFEPRKTVNTFSGGMKRRLSVGLALLGDPLVVIFDEPTTGVDPASRRSVWDAIHDAKRGRSILVTTHSMEEAEVLADKVAILVRGKVHALGSTLSLKSRYCLSRFHLFISLLSAHSFVLPDWRVEKMRRDVAELVMSHLGDAVLKNSLAEDEELSPRTTAKGTSRSAFDEFYGDYEDDEGNDEDNYDYEDEEDDDDDDEEDEDEDPFSARQRDRKGQRSMRRALFNSSARSHTFTQTSTGAGAGAAMQHKTKQNVSFSIGASAAPLLADLFTDLERRKRELGISQMQLTVASLEDVFLAVVQSVEVGVAAAEGRLELVNINGRMVRVPVGAEFVALPPVADDSFFLEAPSTLRCGKSASVALEIWKIKWLQDDRGLLHMVSALSTGETIMPRKRSSSTTPKEQQQPTRI